MKRTTAALATALLAVAPQGCGPDSAGFAWVLTAAAAVQAQSDAAQEEGLILRRVWTGTEIAFYASSPSPDGRYLTDIERMTGNLAVLDLLSGELHRVTSIGSWADPSFAGPSVFSPDGTQIAYNWFNGSKPGCEIRVIDSDGTNPHVLVPSHEDRNYFFIDDWSSDGRHLLVQSVGQEGIQLALVSTADGSFRVLKSLGSEYAGQPSFSPDDRYVAFTYWSQEGSKDNDIFAISVADGREFRLLSGPSDDRLMGFTPDGRSILFYSDREVTQGIWRLPIGPDLAAGEPELLRADVWRLVPLGFSRDAYFFGVTIEERQVHTGAVDLAAGRFLRMPTPVQDPSEGLSAAGDWSPDGQYVAYVTNDPSVQSWRLVIRPVTGDDAREIPLELRSIRKVRWAPDGKAVMIVGIGAVLCDALFRVDLATGRLERLACFTGEGTAGDARSVLTIEGSPRYLEFSPDGRTIYFARGDPILGDAEIVARDITSGMEREIATVRSLLNLSVSPDGRTLAVLDWDRSSSTRVSRLLTVSTQGGQIRELYSAPDSTFGFGLNSGIPWTADGRHILLVSEGGAAWKISSSGGEPQRLFELPGSGRWRDLRLHPDGSRIAYSSGEGRAEIWMIQNIPGAGAGNEGR